MPDLRKVLEDVMPARPGDILPPGCTRTVAMLLITLIACLAAAGLVLAIYLEKDDE